MSEYVSIGRRSTTIFGFHPQFKSFNRHSRNPPASRNNCWFLKMSMEKMTNDLLFTLVLNVKENSAFIWYIARINGKIISLRFKTERYVLCCQSLAKNAIFFRRINLPLQTANIRFYIVTWFNLHSYEIRHLNNLKELTQYFWVESGLIFACISTVFYKFKRGNDNITENLKIIEYPLEAF